MRSLPIRSLPVFLAPSDLLAGFVLAYRSAGFVRRRTLCRLVPRLDGRVNYEVH
jgi:hypothetical protein